MGRPLGVLKIDTKSKKSCSGRFCGALKIYDRFWKRFWSDFGRIWGGFWPVLGRFLKLFGRIWIKKTMIRATKGMLEK